MPSDPEKPKNADPPDPVDAIGMGGYTGVVSVGVKHLSSMQKSADSKVRHDSSWKSGAEEEPEEPRGGSSE
jgi:hypothetical protein